MTQSASRRMKRKNWRKTVFLVSMLILPVAQWLVFWLYVNIDSVLIAFQFARGGWTLSNFSKLFMELGEGGSILSESVINTFVFFGVNLLIIMPLCFMISYFLYRKIAGYRIFRIVFYLPQIISAVVMTTVFSSFIAPNGPFGVLMKAFGAEEVPELLSNSSYALGTIVFYTCWTSLGANMLLFSGAMSRIPLEVLESSRLDGCYAFKELVYIIFPMVFPTISTLIVFTCTGLFNSSGPILLFTQGMYGTFTISYWIYEQVYVNNIYNNVAAAGLFFTAIGIPFILLVRWLLDRIPAVEY